MTFTRTKPLGWATNEILTSAQANTLDEDHADAIDGVGGGAYTITAPLSIDGDDITLGAGTDIVTIGDGTATLIVDAATDFQQGVNASGSASTFTTAVTVNDTFTCSAGVNLGNAAGDAIAVAGTVTCSAPVTFNDDVTLADPVTLSGDGRIKYRAPGTINNAAGSLVVTTTNHYICAAATLSADRVWTIDDTGAANGDWLLIKNKDSNWTITVNDPAAANLANLKEGTVADTGLFMRVGGSWILFFTAS